MCVADPPLHISGILSLIPVTSCLACTYFKGGDKQRKAILHFINTIPDDSKMELFKGVNDFNVESKSRMFWHSLRFCGKNEGHSKH